MRKVHSYSPQTLQVAEILGTEIARARRARRFTQAELAERAGISVSTLSSVERGSPAVSIGIVLEVATLLGIDLLGDESPDLQARVARAQDRLRAAPVACSSASRRR